jgi:tetratricopeptide (TPR) repeat protein
MKKTLLLLTSLLAAQLSFAQGNNKQLALAKGTEAVRLEDEEGKYDEAIALFAEAQKLDPDNIDYYYETAYAYQGKKEHAKAVEILEKLLNHKDVNGRVYQALGNNYDYLGKADKAIQTYEKGLKKFPAAGELYLELGNMKLAKQKLEDALNYYEQGIEKAPQFPSNYYWAARLYCNSSEEVWGMLYGEIFMNLERSTKRTAEISKLLFDTYKSEIKLNSDTLGSVSFSKYATITLDDLKDPKGIRLPFGISCYEPLMIVSILGARQIDINSLADIRSRFLDAYFSGKNFEKYPNALFNYQQTVQKAGHFDAYSHWLLMKGDEYGFTTWKSANKSKWEAFMKWFPDNKMPVTKANRFYRAQY